MVEKLRDNWLEPLEYKLICLWRLSLAKITEKFSSRLFLVEVLKVSFNSLGFPYDGEMCVLIFTLQMPGHGLHNIIFGELQGHIGVKIWRIIKNECNNFIVVTGG